MDEEAMAPALDAVVRLREKLQQMMALNPMKNEAGG
jgi:hypothetical protein